MYGSRIFQLGVVCAVEFYRIEDSQREKPPWLEFLLRKRKYTSTMLPSRGEIEHLSGFNTIFRNSANYFCRRIHPK